MEIHNLFFVIFNIFGLCLLAYYIVKSHNMIFSDKVLDEKEKAFLDFRNKIKRGDKAVMKPFLHDLYRLIQDTVEDTEDEESNKAILYNYHFYNNIYEKILDDKYIDDQDLIEFANLHIYYSDFVKQYRRCTSEDHRRSDDIREMFSLN